MLTIDHSDPLLVSGGQVAVEVGSSEGGCSAAADLMSSEVIDSYLSMR